MNERLEKYFNSLFEGVPDTQAVRDLRDEIYQNTLDKYNDLLSQGKSEEASFTQAVSGIGDIDSIISSNSFRRGDGESDYYTDEEVRKNEIFCNFCTAVSVLTYIISIVPPVLSFSSVGASMMLILFALATFLMTFAFRYRPDRKKCSLKIDLIKELEGNDYSKEMFEKSRRLSAFMFSALISLYIVSLAPPILLIGTRYANAGIIMMFAIIAVSTSAAVYYSITKPKLDIPHTDTIIDEFKEWRGEQRRYKELLKTIDIVIFSVAAVVYLAVSFSTNDWEITWLIFAIAAVVYEIVQQFFKLADCRDDAQINQKKAPKHEREN